MPLKPELLEILACPKCKQSVKETDAGIECQNCRLTYHIKDGIPVMLAEEASPTK